MLTGKPPFDGASAVVLMHCHLNEPPPRPGDKVEEIPRELDDLVVKLMAKAPADRPWDAAAVGAGPHRAPRQGRAGRADPHGLARARTRPRPIPAGPAVGRPGAAAPEEETQVGHPRRTLLGIRDPRAMASGIAARLLEPRRCSRSPGWSPPCSLIGGFIAYWVWPPSAEYLYRQAEALMASSAPVRLAHGPRRVPRPARPPVPRSSLPGTDPQVARPDPPRGGRGPRQDPEQPGQDSTHRAPGRRRADSTSPYDSLAAKAAAEGDEVWRPRCTGARWPRRSSPTIPTSEAGTSWPSSGPRSWRRGSAIAGPSWSSSSSGREAALDAGRPSEALAIQAMLSEKYGQYTRPRRPARARRALPRPIRRTPEPASRPGQPPTDLRRRLPRRPRPGAPEPPAPSPPRSRRGSVVIS